MYPRLLSPPKKSFFLFGPRGTGKSSWARSAFPDGQLVDLLDADAYTDLLASPSRLAARIDLARARRSAWVVIDEVQRVPELLNEVHRLIESEGLRFVLTGSSARKLKRGRANLLAGRALLMEMHPLTARELGSDFDLKRSLRFGNLPAAYVDPDPHAYLRSYVKTYLREEVLQEGLVRNLGSFARFLEAASFSQAMPLNVSAVARDCSVERKVVEDYFSILEDLLIARRIPVFAKKAKRKLVAHSKFFFFDAGVYRAIRPKGPLDSPDDIDGPALETLVFQEARALNEYHRLGYEIFHWRTADHRREVDLVLYGERGLIAIEVKRATRIRDEDLSGLLAFREDYPMARCHLFCGGSGERSVNGVLVQPFASALANMRKILEPA